MITDAKKPVLYVGGGVIKADAAAELKELAELTRAPVVTTLMARGAFPDSHPQHLGMPGMHGTVAAVGGLQRADLIVALGARFDDRVTGKLDTFAPDALIVHADIDPAEISKNRRADVPIVGDCKEVIAELITAVQAEHAHGRETDHAEWWAQLNQWRSKYPLGYTDPDDGSLAPQYVIERIGKLVGPDAVYLAGVGQHQMWAAQFIDYENPRTWINSGGARHDGVRGPRRARRQGRHAGHPGVGDRRRRLLPDDQPGAGHLRDRGHPCQDRDHQQRQPRHGPPMADPVLQQRYSNTNLGDKKAEVAGTRVPDFVKLAEAYGCIGLRCEKKDDVDAIIEQAMAINDQPVVIDFVVHKDAMVWPMVAAAHQQRRHQVRARHSARLGGDGGMSQHTLSVLVEDKPGVLVRIACVSPGAASTSTHSRSGRPSTRRSPG